MSGPGDGFVQQVESLYRRVDAGTGGGKWMMTMAIFAVAFAILAVAAVMRDVRYKEED